MLSQAAMRGRSAALVACLSARGASGLSAAAPSPSLLASIRDPTLLDGSGFPPRAGGGVPSFRVEDPGAPSSGPDAAVADVRRMGEGGRRGGHRPGERGAPGLEGRHDRARAVVGPVEVEPTDRGEPGRRRGDHDARVRQAPGGVARRGGLRSLFPGLLRGRGGSAELGGRGFLSPSPFVGDDGASPRGRIMAVHEAVGVCALITPWNFPIAMITRKVGPALAAGCTTVVKPSELTPLTAIALRTLAARAGVPEGVFELVTADGSTTPEVGEEMCTSPHVRKVSFTGSTRVGKELMRQCSGTVKRLSLELGGNAAFIVFEDADVDQAVDAAMASKFRNAGQTCVCADRFLVHKDVEQEFVSKLEKKMSQLVVGHGLESDTTMGPLISDLPVKAISDKVRDALSEGATCVSGGKPMPSVGPNYFQPTLLANVSPDSSIWRTETFGPVVAVSSFETEEEAVELANDTASGLASYFCTRDMSRAFRVSSRLENGIVGVNEGIISNAAAPFGGVKESGMGREGSSMGLSEYLETKYIFLNT
ncbi:hypothetical protein THAOC_28693 [Thalassiosira oceanica]|uniref:Succinate-semialdehyde dehydrogenase, mitochondrial n=1 Tax=Thalassiosira oceanica TaxID=159749 RepID=K0RT48_THAOC|nr:hypothetical protein THAOC_28693 [Thalassiosira oceanica]|eukprot:EJK52076.1 hypothetical protein THAOC_28693 [Thalassiosira oceanica]